MGPAAAAKSLQLCPALCNPIDSSPPGSPAPWDSPGKNPGVGCHFLLQCMKVKSESEVTQSCLTLCNPMDCSLPGSSAHGIFQARVLEWGAIAFSASGPYKMLFNLIHVSQGFPHRLVDKESTCNAGAAAAAKSLQSCLTLCRPGFDPWVGQIPWRRKWQPTPGLLPGKFHGGYSR